MSKLIHKSNVFHPLINGVAFTQSACATFSISEEVTDDQAEQFVHLPQFEVVAERQDPPTPPVVPPETAPVTPPAAPTKPETAKQKKDREQAEAAAAAKKAQEEADAQAAAQKEVDDAAADADKTKTDAGSSDAGETEDEVF